MAKGGPAEVPKVTITERRSLQLAYNLGDAQNYVTLTTRQQAIIDRLSDIFAVARSTAYADLKDRFLSVAFSRLGQWLALGPTNRPLPCYSATIGLEIAATYIRLHRRDGRAVGLIHPTFDTLRYISARHDLSVVPLEDQGLTEPDGLCQAAGIGTLILTLPNNPTGFHLDRDRFARLVDSCRRSNTLLIIDCCYRYYSEEGFDYYDILGSADIDYMLVEDTGKLFPLLDIKLGILNCNPRIYPSVNSIHSDFLLEVSKFNMAVIAEFLEIDDPDAKGAYLALVESNRTLLERRLRPWSLQPVGGRNINVQLLRLPSGIESTDLQIELERRGVGIIDATKLYWANLPLGRRHVRVALSRDPDYFARGIRIVEEAVRELAATGPHR